MNMQGASSPYRPLSRAPSPFARPVDIPYEALHALPSGPAQVGPGATTYTTSRGQDGSVVYHLFTAVPARYQTPNGVITGIQWMPATTTTHLPPGAIPTEHAGFAHKEESRSALDWQREDEIRRKQEEKEARRIREHSRTGSDYELKLARERDAQSSIGRERRKSFVGNAGPPASNVTFPQAAPSTTYPSHPSVAAGYPPSPYHGYVAGYANSGGHSRGVSVGTYEITKQMQDLDFNKPERERKVSFGHPRRYSTKESPYERPRTISGNFSDRSNPYSSPSGTNAYVNPKGHYSSSPNVRPGEFPPHGKAGSTGYPTSNPSSSPDLGRSTAPFGHVAGGYPPGHVLYDPNQQRSRGPSRPASRVASRAPSPNSVPISRSASPMLGKSPLMRASMMPGEPQQLPAPEAFSRPINAASSFTYFDPIKVLEMEDVHDTVSNLPRMPSALSSHDIRVEDWRRCMQDLSRSWLGQLPVAGTGPDGRPPRKSKLARDLIELWNTSFFLAHGVELILYKGNERRTGAQAGLVESHLFRDGDSFESDTNSDYSDFDGSHGRSALNSSERRHREEKRRRRKERERKAHAYTVFVACIKRTTAPYGAGVPPPVGYPAAMPAGHSPAGYGTPSLGYPPMSYAAPAGVYGTPHNAPLGIPMTRSRGHGGGY